MLASGSVSGSSELQTPTRALRHGLDQTGHQLQLCQPGCGAACPHKPPVAACPWVGILLGCLCQERNIALELLRLWPWGCEVAPGKMPAVLGSLVPEQCPQRTQVTVVELGGTDTHMGGHLCSLVQTQWHAHSPCHTDTAHTWDFHTCAATCTFEEAQGSPVGTVSPARGSHKDRSTPASIKPGPWHPRGQQLLFETRS